MMAIKFYLHTNFTVETSARMGNSGPKPTRESPIQPPIVVTFTAKRPENAHSKRIDCYHFMCGTVGSANVGAGPNHIDFFACTPDCAQIIITKLTIIKIIITVTVVIVRTRKNSWLSCNK